MKKAVAILSILLVGALVVIGFLVFGKGDSTTEKKEDKKEVKEEIVITLDVDGGTPVENIKLEKGKTATLPTTTKEGYTFEGWYLEDKKIEADYVYETDVTLKAKWKKVEVKPKTFTVSFNSNGGSKVSSITVECGKTLPTLPTPKKDAYNFISWADKNGKVILKGALLSCENITLYANWEYDGPVANPEQNNTKTYTCPEGYYLDGKDKCSTTGTVREKCEGERVYEYEGKCVTISNTVRKDAQASCGKTTVHTGNGHTEEVQGELFKFGTYYCYFKQVNDSYEQANSSNCTSRSHKWNSENNRCYYYRGEANQFVTSTCNHLTGYAYISNPNQFSGVNGLNGGCFPVKAKTQYCDDGYKFITGSCVKTIDATLK